MSLSTTPVQAVNGSAISVTSFNITIAAPGAGNLLVLQYAGQNKTITSITGGGVTWAKATQSAVARDAEIWYGPNSSGSGTTLTVNLSGSVGVATDFVVTEWSGAATGSPLDQINNATNPGSSTATVSLTPTSGKNAVILAVLSYAGTPGLTGGGGWTALTNPDARYGFAYQVVASTTGSYTATYTAVGSAWEMDIADFLAEPAVTGKLFEPSPLTGIGTGGPFFRNPIG